MLVSTLANSLGLDADANQEECFAEIERRQRLSATRREVQSNNENTLLAKRMHGLADRGLSVREIAAAVHVDPHEVNQTLGIAEEIGGDRFLLGKDVLNREQLEAVMLARLEAEHANRERDVPILGEDIDAKARSLLASRGNYSPSGEEYLAACQECGAA
jgi:hypothetical protein